jgi:hypothetical protein
VVSSTRGSALANDAATGTGTSLFTEYLVTGLLGEAQDVNNDGYVDLREIYDYVRTQLTTHTRQVPHCRFDGDAAVSLARRPVRTPAIAKVPPPGYRPEPSFTLAENVITLRDVDPDERLRPETVEIYRLGAELDCVAETDDGWLRPYVQGERLVIELYPRVGPNRGKVLVRDRRSGTAQVVRVEAYVRQRTAAAAPPAKGGGAPGPAASPPARTDAPRQREPERPFMGPPPPRPETAPPHGPPPGHGQPPPPATPAQPTEGTAVAALVVSVAAVLLSICFIGWALAIVALVLAGKADRTLAGATVPTGGRGYVLTARILSWLAIVATVLIVALAAIGSLADSGAGTY